MHPHTNQVVKPPDFDEPSSQWLPGLVRLLDEQADLCGRLDVLSQKQSDHVRAGETEPLLTVLAERQPLIDRVVEINAVLEPLRASPEATLGRLSEVDRRSVEARIDDIAGAVDRIRRRDDQDRQVLEEQRRAVADELAGMGRLRGAVAAYAGTPGAGQSGGQQPPRFHDRQG